MSRSKTELLQGTLDVNYGSVYPALRRLESSGYATAHWAPSESNRRALCCARAPSMRRWTRSCA